MGKRAKRSRRSNDDAKKGKRSNDDADDGRDEGRDDNHRLDMRMFCHRSTMKQWFAMLRLAYQALGSFIIHIQQMLNDHSLAWITRY